MKVYKTRRSFKNKEDLEKYNQTLRKSIHRKRNKKQRDLMRAFGAIILSTFIVWIPAANHVLMLVFIDGHSIPLGMFTIAYITFISHTVIHPLMEGCLIPEIKETLKRMLGITYCKKKAKKRRESIAAAMIDPSDLGFGEPKGCCRRCRDMCAISLIPSSE